MTTDPSPAAAPAPISAVEARILGSLVEKEATTPEQYPLTANAVLLACNQKSNRDPVLELEAGEVGHALRELEGRGLVRSVHGSRAQRYEHRFAQAWSVTRQQQALLAVLLLRGAQTAAELLTRCERLATFADVDEVRQVLERLGSRQPALATNLGRAPGQREDRYLHLLCGPVDASHYAVAVARPPASGDRAGLEARIEALEAEVAALRQAVDELSAPRD